MKQGTKTTVVGLIIGALLAAWAVLQPALTGGDVDWKVLAPSVVIAIVMYLQKDTGNWKTTTVGALMAALMAGASAYLTDPLSWTFVAGAILTSIGSSLTKDHDKDGGKTTKPTVPTSSGS